MLDAPLLARRNRAFKCGAALRARSVLHLEVSVLRVDRHAVLDADAVDVATTVAQRSDWLAAAWT